MSIAFQFKKLWYILNKEPETLYKYSFEHHPSMKIGIEASTLGSKSTGTNRYLNCLMEQLNKSGNEIIPFTPFSGTNIHAPIPLSLQKHYYRQFRLKKDIENANVECAIFPDYFMPRAFTKPAAVVIHDLSFISQPQFYSSKFVKYITWQVKQTLRQNPLIVTISRHTKNNIVNLLGVNEERVHIVQGYSNLWDDEPAVNSSIQPGTPYFLCVGHIEPRKNLTFMIEGFLEWKKQTGSDIKLKIVGELWIKSPAIASLLSRFRDNPHIEFMGYIPDQQLKDAYRNAAGFVHTSFEEGFGFPILEAMHFKLPIICTAGIATEEISAPLSIPVDPNNKQGYFAGLTKMHACALRREKIVYPLPYSAESMARQLSGLLNELESRIRKNSSSGIPKARTGEEALQKTLVYSGMFNSGMSAEKIHTQLFDKEIDSQELQETILRYKTGNILWEQNGYLFLTNQINGFYRKSSKKIDKIKLRKLLNFLQKAPLISSIAFSGGTTHYGLENHEDIDLFIIAKPYTTYIVYFILHIYSKLFNARKELCANFLIDETQLEISISYDFYTAHQIVSLSAFKNEKMLNRFWNANSWIKNFFPNFTIKPQAYSGAGKIYNLLRPLNFLLYLIYKWLYHKRVLGGDINGSLVLTENCMKLHTNDNRYKIIREFGTLWREFSANRLTRVNDTGVNH